MATTPRTPSAIDAIADAYLTTMCELDPLAATSMGVPGYDHLTTDLSPAGIAARAEAGRAVLAELTGAEPADATDEVTLAAMRERVGLEIELFEAGEMHANLNNISSPVQFLRDVYDIMPTDTAEQWSNIASRMALLPETVDGYIASLRWAAERGRVPARRQVEICVTQARDLADPATSFFPAFVTGEAAQAALADDAALRADLERAAEGALAAYDRLADFLTDELAPLAPAQDAVGRERYALWSRFFLGSQVDLEETYRWGVAELDRIIAEQEAVAAQVVGEGASVTDAVAALDADPERTLHGTEELREWMQRVSDEAIDALAGVHFDIADPIRRLECMIAPTQTGGIYYTGPSDDFSRPGRMWWSVPADVTEFNTWREKTTVYHEGVPGHHLQVAQAVFVRDRLNAWRRLGCWVSGHGEGWALYAERLMADLGFLDDPGDRLGMLDGQRMRAARVVFDIGLHLGLEVPERWGSGTWDAEKGLEFLRANINMPDSFIRFELDRYLGWPGQAPSYKIGERLWETIRDESRAAAEARGEEFSLRDFHARALDLGSVGLDVLHDALI